MLAGSCVCYVCVCMHIYYTYATHMNAYEYVYVYAYVYACVYVCVGFFVHYVSM